MTPELLWFNGSVVQWDRGMVHVSSEVAVRGATVFEGLRSYWHPDLCAHFVLDLDAHLERLFESAMIMRFPCEWGRDDLEQAIADLIAALRYEEDLYVRPALYLEAGSYGFRSDDTRVGAYVAAFAASRSDACRTGIRCCVSSWRRAGELIAPPRVKAGAFYQTFRLPRIEAEERGFDDTILLNSRDTVSEASGASVFVVRHGEVATPPTSAAILESITRRRVIELLEADFGIAVVQRDIDRTELYVAEEIFLAGTLTEIQPVIDVDGYAIGTGAPGPITSSCRDRYFEICSSGSSAPPGWLTRVQHKRDSRR